MSSSQTHVTIRATPAKQVPASWTDVYRIFTDIADIIHAAVADRELADKFISKHVELLYAQRQGDLAWDLAYERWIEPSDDDEEV